MTFPEWQHKLIARRPLIGDSSRYIEVCAGLHWLAGNARPFFSVTGEIGRVRAVEPEEFGRTHDKVVEHWPELAPVVALRCCDDRGVPMHPIENGLYWLAGALGGLGQRYHGGNTTSRSRTPDECRQILADHLRLTDAAVLDELLTEATNVFAMGGYHGVREWFGFVVDNQRKRWQAEATAAIALLDRLASEGGSQ